MTETRPIVLLLEPIHEDALAYLLQHTQVRMAEGLSPEALRAQVSDVEGIIIRANGRIDRALMVAAPELKVVGRHGTGVEAIDLEAASELGVVVVNTPYANVESVAEHALGMMVALAKRLPEADRAVRAGDWEARYRLTGQELYGKTLGLVGLGRIGSRLAELSQRAFDMPILYYDVQGYPELEKSLGAARVDLDELLETADVVSLHVPLLPDTERLIDEDALRRMKPSAYLINTSRGAVVDMQALIEALETGVIAGAGLDVYDPEPLPADSPLLKLENVILSPHMAAHTEESLRRMAMVVEDIVAVIMGQEPAYRVR